MNLEKVVQISLCHEDLRFLYDCIEDKIWVLRKELLMIGNYDEVREEQINILINRLLALQYLLISISTPSTKKLK